MVFLLVLESLHSYEFRRLKRVAISWNWSSITAKGRLNLICTCTRVRCLRRLKLRLSNSFHNEPNWGSVGWRPWLWGYRVTTCCRLDVLDLLRGFGTCETFNISTCNEGISAFVIASIIVLRFLQFFWFAAISGYHVPADQLGGRNLSLSGKASFVDVFVIKLQWWYNGLDRSNFFAISID